ncbi:MAG: hypothetical protein ACR2IA_08360, partial [Pyrinomonadaceae bacterium]
MRLHQSVIIFSLLFLFSFAAPPVVKAQEPNPVERQVANPLTDTPNINPISPQNDITAPKTKKLSFEPEGGDGEVVVYSLKETITGEKDNRVIVREGDVEVLYGIYRLQADKITIYE